MHAAYPHCAAQRPQGYLSRFYDASERGRTTLAIGLWCQIANFLQEFELGQGGRCFRLFWLKMVGRIWFYIGFVHFYLREEGNGPMFAVDAAMKMSPIHNVVPTSR